MPSMRAIAKELGISHSYLSRLPNGIEFSSREKKYPPAFWMEGIDYSFARFAANPCRTHRPLSGWLYHLEGKAGVTVTGPVPYRHSRC